MAMNLDPGNVRVLISYAHVCFSLGDIEACLAAARSVQELDPVSTFANHSPGHASYFARRYKEAIPALRQALERDPQNPRPHYRHCDVPLYVRRHPVRGERYHRDHHHDTSHAQHSQPLARAAYMRRSRPSTTASKRKPWRKMNASGEALRGTACFFRGTRFGNVETRFED